MCSRFYGGIATGGAGRKHGQWRMDEKRLISVKKMNKHTQNDNFLELFGRFLFIFQVCCGKVCVVRVWHNGSD